jgi:hypothetical protein
MMRDIDLQSMDDALLGNEERISISAHNIMIKKFYETNHERGALGGSIVRKHYSSDPSHTSRVTRVLGKHNNLA